MHPKYVVKVLLTLSKEPNKIQRQSTFGLEYVVEGTNVIHSKGKKDPSKINSRTHS